MRTMISHQQRLMQAFIDHEHAAELKAVAEILDASREALALVERDLVEGRRRDVGKRQLNHTPPSSPLKK